MLNKDIEQCKKCSLCKTATHKVICRGSKTPKVLIIGEAPGQEEDKQGIPFVGRSGQLLDEWLISLGFAEKDYAIINVIKCRPPDNRNPTMEEIDACLPFLIKQIELYKPTIIIILGKVAFKTLLPDEYDDSILKHIGSVYKKDDVTFIIMPHPAYCLRNNYTPPLEIINKQFSQELKFNIQKASTLSIEQMIPAPLAVVHEFCKQTEKTFKDITKNIVLIDDAEFIIINLSNLSTTTDKNIIAYQLESNNYIFSKIFIDSEEQNISFLFKIKQEIIKKGKDEEYVSLHNHSMYSLGDGYGDEQYISEQASNFGYKAYAITDHGTLGGTMYLQKALLAKNIKPIIGMEAFITLENSLKEMYYIAPDKKKKAKKRYHLVLLVKNKIGYKNLLYLNYLSYTEYFYYKACIPFKELLKHSEGIVVGTACSAGLITSFLLKEQYEQAENYLKELVKVFGENLFIEIMPVDYEPYKKITSQLIELAEKYNVKLVITTDVHFPIKQDKKYRDAIRAVSFRKKIDELDITSEDYHMVSSQEIKEMMKKNLPYVIPKLVDTMIHNTKIISDMCNFTIEPITEGILPNIAENPAEELKRLVLKGVKDKPYPYEQIKEQLNLEIERIVEKGYANYFLLVAEYVRWAKKNGIVVGPGRGSAGASLVSWLLNITEIDPIKYNLMFDRFISVIRKDMPDIDIDFEDKRRDEIINHLVREYGNNRVAKVVTYSRWHGKGAIRDAGRIFGIPIPQVEKVANLVITRSGGDARTNFCLTDTFEEFEQAKRFAETYPEAKDIAIHLEGRTRHMGVHAAGLIITNKPIYEYVPVTRVGGEIVVAWEKEIIEELGLIKFDILGLRTLTIIKDIMKQTNIKQLPKDFDDKNTYEKVFSTGKCLGIFQFETTGLSKLAKSLRIDNFQTVYDATTLYRPGPLHSGETAEFIRRHIGEVSWEYDHKLLEPITKETHGLILYQEQVMKVMFDIGKFSWATAEAGRKIMTKSKGKDAFNKMRKEFMNNALKEHHISEIESKKIFDVVCTFGSYGFNKTHAVGYSIISYWTAWLKANYTKEFFKVILSYAPDNQLPNYIREARLLGIQVKIPDINLSKIGFNFSNNDIVCGIDRVRGIGVESTKKIIEKQPFTSVDDFIKRIKPSITVFRNLALIGAFDTFKISSRWLSENAKDFISGKLSTLQTDLNGFFTNKKIQRTDYSEKEKAFLLTEFLNYPAEKPAIDYFENPFEGKVEFEQIGELKFLDYTYKRFIKGIVTSINFKQEGLEGNWAMFDNVLERRYAHLNLNDGTGNVLVHLSPEQYTYYKQILERKEKIPVIIMGHSIPSYSKIYCDAMVVLDDIDKTNPILKYVLENGRQAELKKIQEQITKYTKVNIIISATYKVSKNKNPYVRIRFDDNTEALCFKLSKTIFIAGQIITYRQEQEPFISEILKVY